MASVSICSHPDCSKPVKARGLCSQHWYHDRFRQDWTPRKEATGVALKWLFEHINHESDECLIWPFNRTDKGYAVVRYEGRVQSVSRIVCEKVHGPPPEEWYHAAHSCGNGHLGCISQRHLSWKTPVANSNDRLGHGTVPLGSKCGSAKLTESEVRLIRDLEGRGTYAAIGRMFGVDGGTVRRIILRIDWSHLP